MPAKISDQGSFEKKVIRQQGCWEWDGAINSCGYTSMKGKQGHRVSWEIYRGPIPQDLYVLHTCDNRRCTNPDHLFLGTNDDNMKDMVVKGRGRSCPGDTSPNAKLTQKQAEEIRVEYNNSRVSQQAIADRFNVSQRVISLIVRGITYRENPNLPGTF